MKSALLGLFMFALVPPLAGQDLNCRVQVIHPQQQLSDTRIFKTLEKAISDFLNNRKWSDNVFQVQERIQANMLIRVIEWDGNNRFTASAQIQSYRPVYGTSYNSLVFMINDEDWEFLYSEQEPIEYVPTGRSGNLAFLLAFYANVIMGMDYDTFSPGGGNRFFLQAQNIVNQAQNTGFKGWRSFESLRNRYWLIEDLLNTELKPVRDMMYIYHRKGLDAFFESTSKGRNAIFTELPRLEEANNRRPSSMLMQLFFTAKADELSNILKEAGPGERSKAINTLSAIDPSNANKYRTAGEEGGNQPGSSGNPAWQDAGTGYMDSNRSGGSWQQ